jgi:hypothetical protein
MSLPCRTPCPSIAARDVPPVPHPCGIKSQQQQWDMYSFFLLLLSNNDNYNTDEKGK